MHTHQIKNPGSFSLGFAVIVCQYTPLTQNAVNLQLDTSNTAIPLSLYSSRSRDTCPHPADADISAIFEYFEKLVPLTLCTVLFVYIAYGPHLRP
jgi:hypothetical protein